MAALSVDKLRRYRDLIRRRANEGHCSSIRQMFEIIYLRLRNDIPAYAYFASGLYRSTIPWAAKKDYLWGQAYLRRVGRINDPSCGFAVLNKVVTHGLLQSFGVPTPPFYGLLNRVDGQTFDGHPLRSVDDLARLIQRTSLDDVCLKPVGGWGGKGFLRVRLERGDPVRAARGDGGDLMTLGEFWSTHIYGDGGASYLCQGAVQQHPDLAALHPESVNTARVWMCQPRRGEWRMYEAILRMGVGSMIVDNTSSGGITSRIDLKSGVLASALDMTAERIVSDRHPTTGVQLTGRVLPMWEDVGKLCLRACRAFPYLRLMGLDVAFGRESPLIIEVESSPGWDHQITFDHGVAPLLRELAVAGRFDWRA